MLDDDRQPGAPEATDLVNPYRNGARRSLLARGGRFRRPVGATVALLAVVGIGVAAASGSCTAPGWGTAATPAPGASP